MKKSKLIRYVLMWGIATVITLIFLKLANDTGQELWINLSWLTGFWFGVETLLLFEILKEYSDDKKEAKKE
jgi:hypothetical protein